MNRIHLVLGSAVVALLCQSAVAGELRTTTLAVEGMTCAACPLTVKTLLGKVPGVDAVTVDFKTHLAQVRYDPDRTQPERLASAVREIGFPTTVKK